MSKIRIEHIYPLKKILDFNTNLGVIVIFYLRSAILTFFWDPTNKNRLKRTSKECKKVLEMFWKIVDDFGSFDAKGFDKIISSCEEILIDFRFFCTFTARSKIIKCRVEKYCPKMKYVCFTKLHWLTIQNFFGKNTIYKKIQIALHWWKNFGSDLPLIACYALLY